MTCSEVSVAIRVCLPIGVGVVLLAVYLSKAQGRQTVGDLVAGLPMNHAPLRAYEHPTWCPPAKNRGGGGHFLPILHRWLNSCWIT